MQLVLATFNQDKIKEIKAALKGLPLKILTLPERRTGRLKETGKTLEENALQKAKIVYRRTGLPSLADDSGLEVDYLKGAPGVRSSRFSGEKATYLENNMKLLRLLRNVPARKRKARFRSVLALVLDENKYYLLEGKISGRIADQMRGNRGFGYDPVFYLPKYKQTFAQMTLREKNRISHRGRALRKLRRLLSKLL